MQHNQTNRMQWGSR